MMKKSTSTIVSIFVAFVLVSALFSANGNVYAQNTTEVSLDNSTNATGTTSPTGEELPPTTSTDGLVTENATSLAPEGEVVEETTGEHSENTTGTGTVTRDSQTILLEGEILPEGNYLHLYDSTPYQINNGHVAAKIPCGEDNQTSINILLGQAPDLAPAELEYIAPLSDPGNLCLYHADVSSSEGNPMTDIAIQNNSTEDIDFPATSTIVLGVNEISPLPSEDHDEG